MEYVDDRSPAEMRTHTCIVYGRDSFMSGWGKAKGGDSYAGWACYPADVQQVKEWVRGRTDIEQIAVYRPGPGAELPEELVPDSCRHFHVYVVGENHPALKSE